jgi:hypothetical protein
MKDIKFGFLFSYVLFFTSCVSTKTFLKNDQIPADFGKGNSTIIIVNSGKTKVDKFVTYAFEKYYRGNFESGKNSSATKQNTSSHFYTFNTYIDFNPGSFTSSGRQAPSTDIYFGITDLKTNKIYKNLRYGNYKKCAKFFIQALEVVRSRNE